MERIGVCGFAFGIGRDILSNSRIARIVSEKAREVGAVLILAQFDLPIEFGLGKVLYTPEDPSNPSPTLRVARWMVWEALWEKIDTLYVAFAKPHRRAFRDLRYAVYEEKARIAVIPCDDEINFYPDSSWFCENPQRRTCSREAWRRREGIIERLPMPFYNLVAS